MQTHSEGSLQLCDVRIRCDLDNLEEAGGQSQRNVRIGADVGMHGAYWVAPSTRPHYAICYYIRMSVLWTSEPIE
jgi:hypothetical protein